MFVSRPELVNRVREKLYRLQKEPGWITVFGMAGSGKSVLAAEAVRDHGLIEGEQSLINNLMLTMSIHYFETVKHNPQLIVSLPDVPVSDIFVW